MGVFVSFFDIPVRITIVLVAVMSASTLALTSLNRDDNWRDPFAPYADILLGGTLEAVMQRDFDCRQNIVPVLEKICWLAMETGDFTRIEVMMNVDTGRVRRTVFTPRRMTAGHLGLLWGEPEIIHYGNNTNLHWRDQQVIAIPFQYHRRFSYWLPIASVVFENRVD